MSTNKEDVVFGFLWDNFSLTAVVSYSMITAIAAVLGMFMFIKSYSYNHPARTILTSFQ